MYIENVIQSKLFYSVSSLLISLSIIIRTKMCVFYFKFQCKRVIDFLWKKNIFLSKLNFLCISGIAASRWIFVRKTFTTLHLKISTYIAWENNFNFRLFFLNFFLHNLLIIIIKLKIIEIFLFAFMFRSSSKDSHIRKSKECEKWIILWKLVFCFSDEYLRWYVLYALIVRAELQLCISDSENDQRAVWRSMKNQREKNWQIISEKLMYIVSQDSTCKENVFFAQLSFLRSMLFACVLLSFFRW